MRQPGQTISDFDAESAVAKKQIQRIDTATGDVPIPTEDRDLIGDDENVNPDGIPFSEPITVQLIDKELHVRQVVSKRFVTGTLRVPGGEARNVLNESPFRTKAVIKVDGTDTEVVRVGPDVDTVQAVGYPIEIEAGGSEREFSHSSNIAVYNTTGNGDVTVSWYTEEYEKELSRKDK